MPAPTIRPYEPGADTETVATIWLDASLLAHPFLGLPLLLEHQQLVREKFLSVSENWLACCDGAPVGFISLLDESFVGGLFIAPGWQGRGIGRRLIHHALALKGRLSLEVYLRNEQAVRFYASLGFREVSRRACDDEGLPFENALLKLEA